MAPRRAGRRLSTARREVERGSATAGRQRWCPMVSRDNGNGVVVAGLPCRKRMPPLDKALGGERGRRHAPVAREGLGLAGAGAVLASQRRDS